ncbi:MAG: DUF1540 domain-containing protein [Clostridia bacterium]
MENTGVVCNVCECMHNVECNKCNLPQIQITCEQTGATSMSNPHFCKNYCKK